MNDVFGFRDQLIDEYSSFSRSFSRIAASDIRDEVERQYADGRYWPEPLVQINPNYQRKGTVQQLVAEGVLHGACAELFQVGKAEGHPQPLHLYAHQLQALAKGQGKQSYVVTTGTGSGKSLSFFIPVIDRILKAKDQGTTARTRAIVIYPMNALANSQLEELDKFLHGYPEGQQPFTVARYTGQESKAERDVIAGNPPDILLTNFMMLELILTRFDEVDRRVVDHCQGLEFLILDELHTYRGRQGADVALLVRRLRERLQADELVCIGTSATMSSTGTLADRNKTVAAVASKLFGTPISEQEIIGETLERVTDPLKDVTAVQPDLAAAVASPEFSWSNFEAFQVDPLSIWVELNLGIELPDNEPPRRAKPMTIQAASEKLAGDSGCAVDVARDGLQRFLVAAHEIKTPQGRPPFAFKLHQFISGPGKVLTTLEAPGIRYVTLDAQRFAPGRQGEGTQLYPVHFCRDCGQEYLPVWQSKQTQASFTPREIDDITTDDNEDVFYGFLCPAGSNLPYRGDIEDLPETWLDLSRDQIKIKQNYKKSVPYSVTVNPQGNEGCGESFWYIPGKFRFCLNCGQLHEAHGKDINRLASLSGEGRSSATTILTLTALRQLFNEKEPESGQPDPRKLLGFTDNRQDAALQAGHFNDFVFLLTLRAGLIGALQNSGGELSEEQLADAVFKALGFDRLDEATLTEYLRTPKLMGLARQEAQRTLRYIIGYRLLRDLRRGWRFNNPNLDQLGLLAISYRSLDDFCADSAAFSKSSLLGKLTAAHRAVLCQLIFDTMRRGLCLETRYLDPVEQDKARTSAFAYLNERWAFAPDEQLETSKYLILSKRPEFKGKPRTDLVTGGPRSRMLRDIKTAALWKDTALAGLVAIWKDPEWVELVEELLQAAALYGYVQKHSIDQHLIGWRLNAAALDWCLPEGFLQAGDTRSNQFFRTLYLSISELLRQKSHPLFDFEAQEHTAQVDAGRRQLLEQRFRYTDKDRKDWAQNPAHEAPLERLPVMFCSPTMELGVDISSLNTVYLRNVPPTPANYAQRSGRAGRSGQQALVITYCASLSPHDQWFFHHANEMVHGIVRAPTLDLANRDLVESHLQAVWLANAHIALDVSIAPMLDLDQAGKPLIKSYHDALNDPAVTQRAQASAARVIAQLKNELADSDWFSADYVQKVIERAPQAFSDALERWRVLFDATRTQMNMADQIVKSHTASHSERQNAQRRYGDAARQYAVLLKNGNTQNSDFYTYRYLASQGFLPGYNFPRLPLMAWIPARGGASANGKDDEGSMVSRPRFLALSEFGPRSLIYHQGRMYRVVRAKLNVGSADHISGNSQLATITSLVCSQCGYGHLGDINGTQPLVNRCENCDALLTEHDWVRELYRIETVETVAVERISINDEDRQRQGFELQTTYRFLPGPDGVIQQRKAEVRLGDEALAELTYAPAARLWRINRGWRRRKNKEQLGFYINPITGTWSKQDEPGASDEEGKDEALLDKVPNQRIVPFVEDHRNLLILAPVHALSTEAMATLQAALKRGIEMTFQIEESELVAEPLPKADERRALMFYEAAEGGAGVLTRIASDPASLAQVASNALKLLHHAVPLGPWKLEDLPALEQTNALGNHICEAGCYQCLLSYFNQPDHENINRRNADALKVLVALANAEVQPKQDLPLTQESAPANALLKQWLQALDAAGLRQPDAMQVPVNQGAAIAAGQYKSVRALVFLEDIDADTAALMADKGWQVLNFSDPSQWQVQLAAHPDVFGNHEKTQ
ncbi:DEAD/DEAH box helicase [Pseudomonas sp. ICMP 8385]|uniref:DEAD/DEAH box helicase n=1 Tax=Pseudomonas sp. ICMP 8385 TaxID=1718920 RepID=UPI000C0800A5|nr:DEAD/DEAH box helicase [Pseudomonas sp. ICMP 8385]PHN59440.1 DEAD/DEAH box helicase [Pseudomonas sp. ICMP 8385]